MNLVLAGGASFLLGILFTAAVMSLYGGLVYVTMKMIFEKVRHPKIEAASRVWAENACLAHAALLDEAGHVEAAANLVMSARDAYVMPLGHLMVSGATRKLLHERYGHYLRQGNLLRMAVGKVICCMDHGESLWQGHIRCLQCNRVYGPKDSDDGAPEICQCGHRLVPEINEHRQLMPSSGSGCCRHCYADEKNGPLRKVKPPTYADQMTPIIFQGNVLAWGKCERCDTELLLRFPDDTSPLPALPPPAACPACGNLDPHRAEEHADDQALESH